MSHDTYKRLPAMFQNYKEPGRFDNPTCSAISGHVWVNNGSDIGIMRQLFECILCGIHIKVQFKGISDE